MRRPACFSSLTTSYVRIMNVKLWKTGDESLLVYLSGGLML